MRPIDVIEGKVSVLDRNDVDTDQIIPKQFLKRVERTGFGEFLFYDWIRDGEIELEPNPILVAGRNFGCGSSREHAPWALEDFGFEAIIAPSFADIFYSNCTKIGLLPAIVDEAHCKAIAAGRRGADRRRRRDDRLRHDRRLPVRGAPGGQAPAAERARRHRHHAAERRRDRRVRELGPRGRPGDDQHLELVLRFRKEHGWPSSTREWDASTYQRVALPHEDWARAVLDRLGLEGGETVLDAGCGSGRTTAILIERMPDGRVIAVDGSPSMVEKVREVLRPQDEAIVADLTELELDEQVDAIFSTAVFHWIPDHDALFARMRAPCASGRRPLRRPVRRRGQHRRLPPGRRGGRQARALRDLPRGHREALELRRAGGDRGAPAQPRASPTCAAGSSPGRWTRPSPRSSPRTVCLGAHVERLPEELRDRFVADVLATQGEPLRLDYVRLNIEARARRRVESSRAHA